MVFREYVALFDSDSFHNRKMSDRQTQSVLSALQAIFIIFWQKGIYFFLKIFSLIYFVLFFPFPQILLYTLPLPIQLYVRVLFL